MTFRSRGWEGGGSQQAVSTMKGGVSHGDAPVRARPKDRAMPRPASLLLAVAVVAALALALGLLFR